MLYWEKRHRDDFSCSTQRACKDQGRLHMQEPSKSEKFVDLLTLIRDGRGGTRTILIETQNHIHAWPGGDF